MKRLILLAGLLLPALLAAQDSPFPFGPILNANGRPIAGAIISICANPANATLCTNYATVYSDQARTLPITQSSNPIVTDSLGNVSATFAVPGIYTYTISGAGITSSGPYFIVISCTPGVSCVSVSSNNAFTGNNTHSGTETFTGAVNIGANHSATNKLNLPDGTNLLPSLTFFNQTNSGIYFNNNGFGVGPVLVDNGVDVMAWNPTGSTTTPAPTIPPAGSWSWAAAGNYAGGVFTGTSQDTGLSRPSAGIICADTTVPQNCSGTLKAANLVIPGMGLTLKNGSGGGNYTGTNTAYANVDTTNLCQVVTIPTGWKLAVTASGDLGSNTAAVTVSVSVADIGTTCAGGGTTALKEIQVNGTAAAASEAWALHWVITGDGAAHAISLQAKTSNAANAWIIANTSSSLSPSMVLTLMPSN